MKIERKEPKFEPVVITLESQFEVDVLYELFLSIRGNGEVGNLTENICEDLGEHSSIEYELEGYSKEYFTGILQSNK